MGGWVIIPQERAEFILDRLVRACVIYVWKENWNDICGFDCTYTLVDWDDSQCVLTMEILNRMDYDYFYDLLTKD